MIDDQGFFDWMERDPGPPDKVYTQPNTARLYLPHSAEGFYGGWASRLFSSERLPSGRYSPYAAASVTGWIFYNGHALQHYSIFKSCWASGSTFPNTNGIAFENEGLAGQAFTPEQVTTNARIIGDLQEFHQRKGRVWTPTRPRSIFDLTASLLEHRECVRFGSEPTACPSNRVPWDRILATVRGAAMPEPATKDQIGAVLVALGALGKKLDDANAFVIETQVLLATGKSSEAEKRLRDLYAFAGKVWPA